MPNTIETVLVMLASASIGAVFSSCSPDFGVSGVLDLAIAQSDVDFLVGLLSK